MHPNSTGLFLEMTYFLFALVGHQPSYTRTRIEIFRAAFK